MASDTQFSRCVPPAPEVRLPLFICHSSHTDRDRKFVRDLQAGLRDISEPTVVELDTVAGEDWFAFLRTKLNAARGGIIVISQEMINRSRWCIFEMTFLTTWHRATKGMFPLFPVYMPGVDARKVEDAFPAAKFGEIKDVLPRDVVGTIDGQAVDYPPDLVRSAITEIRRLLAQGGWSVDQSNCSLTISRIFSEILFCKVVPTAVQKSLSTLGFHPDINEPAALSHLLALLILSGRYSDKMVEAFRALSGAERYAKITCVRHAVPAAINKTSAVTFLEAITSSRDVTLKVTSGRASFAVACLLERVNQLTDATCYDEVVALEKLDEFSQVDDFITKALLGRDEFDEEERDSVRKTRCVFVAPPEMRSSSIVPNIIDHYPLSVFVFCYSESATEYSQTDGHKPEATVSNLITHWVELGQAIAMALPSPNKAHRFLRGYEI